MKTHLSRKELEATEWAMDFKKNNPAHYGLALLYAQTGPKGLRVVLRWNTETGVLMCAVAVFEDESFWMDSFPNRKSARDLCRKMGWRIQMENTRESVLAPMRKSYGITRNLVERVK